VSGFYPPRKLFKFIKLLAVRHGGLPVSGAREATAFGLCPTFSRLRGGTYVDTNRPHGFKQVDFVPQTKVYKNKTFTNTYIDPVYESAGH